MDALARLWNKIPAPVRTVVNIALGAAFTALAQYVVNLATPGDFNPNTAVDVLWVGVTTAIVRYLNPVDAAYGIDKA